MVPVRNRIFIQNQLMGVSPIYSYVFRMPQQHLCLQTFCDCENSCRFTQEFNGYGNDACGVSIIQTYYEGPATTI